MTRTWSREELEALDPLALRELCERLAVLQTSYPTTPDPDARAPWEEHLSVLGALGSLHEFALMMREAGGAPRAVGDVCATIAELEDNLPVMRIYLGVPTTDVVRARASAIEDALMEGLGQIQEAAVLCAQVHEELAAGAKDLTEAPGRDREALEAIARFFSERASMLRGPQLSEGGWLPEEYWILP